MYTLGHEIVPLVTEHADDLGREGLVQELQDGLAVRPVAFRDGPLFHVVTSALPDRLDIA